MSVVGDISLTYDIVILGKMIRSVAVWLTYTNVNKMTLNDFVPVCPSLLDLSPHPQLSVSPYV